ncbi:MAG: helix-turn-helix domain-containing protein [Elainellaceae cyanobacterium]
MTKKISSQLISSQVFDSTLKAFGIKGTELSRASGVTGAVISDFRKGKANPSTAVVEKLVNAMEELHPGAWQFFYSELAAARGPLDVAAQLDFIANQIRDIHQVSGINAAAG